MKCWLVNNPIANDVATSLVFQAKVACHDMFKLIDRATCLARGGSVGGSVFLGKNINVP